MHIYIYIWTLKIVAWVTWNSEHLKNWVSFLTFSYINCFVGNNEHWAIKLLHRKKYLSIYLIYVYIYINIYIIYVYIYIYSIPSIPIVVFTSLKCSTGRAKYVDITNGWIKQQSNSSTLLWASCFWQSSGVHILHVRFP